MSITSQSSVSNFAKLHGGVGSTADATREKQMAQSTISDVFARRASMTNPHVNNLI